MGPSILISGSADGCQNYIAALSAAGARPDGRYCPAYAPGYDGLLLSGGGDIHPARFGQENNGSEDIDPARDEAELALLCDFLAHGKPVLGICRGHQLINVGLGGTLRQHIGDGLCRFHRRTADHEGDKIHAVWSAPGSWYRQAYGAVFCVNSSHHQVLGTLGQGLSPVLWSEGGVIEAVEHESLPILSVQFHPERMTGAHRRSDTVDGGAVFGRFFSLFA